MAQVSSDFVAGPVTGTVRGDQFLSLVGSVRHSMDGTALTVTLNEWDTLASGHVMLGRIGFHVTMSTLPGHGTVRALLANVTR